MIPKTHHLRYIDAYPSAGLNARKDSYPTIEVYNASLTVTLAIKMLKYILRISDEVFDGARTLRYFISDWVLAKLAIHHVTE